MRPLFSTLLCVLWLLVVSAGVALGSEPSTEGTKSASAKGGGYRISSPSDEQSPSPLEAMLLLTTQYAVQEIYFFSPSQMPPRLTTTSEIYEGQSLLIVPIVRRYAISDAGQVDVRYSPISILPNGEVEEAVGEITLYAGEAPQEGMLLFPREALSGFYTGKDQGPGVYTIKVDIRDEISGATQTLEREITVVPYEIPALPEGFNANNWIVYYHTKPEPELALPALFAIMEGVEADRINAVSGSLLGFYNQVLSDNPWLLPHFSKRLEEALDRVNNGAPPTSADVMLGLVLSFHLRQMQEKPAEISERIWLETESNRSFDWSYINAGPSEFIHYPQQLDYQWGQFFASGSVVPIYRLVEVLFQDKEAAEKAVPQSIANLKAEHQQALAEAVLRAAQWSLRANALQHRLVRAYLLGIAFNEANDLSPENRKELQAMFAAIIETLKEKQEEAQQQRQQEQKDDSSPLQKEDPLEQS